MDLDATSITSKQFDLNRRGYDPDAVDAHLAEIARAVAEREELLRNLEQKVASLGARVQDAHESEEALRLTLKAAAHAKEELLATARQDAEAMEAEAVRKTEELVKAAEAQTDAMLAAARDQAQDLIRTAIAETDTLVNHIEELRSQVDTSRRVLAGVAESVLPELQDSHQALDEALTKARASAADADVLVASLADAEADTIPAPETADEEPEELAPVDAAGDESEPAAAEEPDHEIESSAESVDEQGEPQAPDDAAEPESADDGENAERHLEVVESAESSSEISSKVDRLLEELREVT